MLADTPYVTRLQPDIQLDQLDLLAVMLLPIPQLMKKSVDTGDVDEVSLILPISHPNVCLFRYHPGDSEWQQEKCHALGLNYIGSNGIIA
jgi:hypothetical protein